jgi:TonB family protein
MSEAMTLHRAIAATLALTLSAMPVAAAELCVAKITPPGFTAAVAAERAAPVFPETDAEDESEGWVRLGFTITATGETKDVAVLDQVGSRSMLKAARQAVSNWRYKPATQDGQAVEQYGNAAEILYRAGHVGNTLVHENVVLKYDEGRTLVAAGKYAEGVAVLEQAFDLPLTLYEQAKLSFALAFAHEKSKDLPRALRHIRHAMIEGGTFLEKAVVPAAQRMRLRLEVANGNFQYAACAAPLPVTDAFDPTGADRQETMRVVDETKRKLASPEPLVVDATLTAKPGKDGGGIWEHPLSRRKFKFVGFPGQVQEFDLSCVKQQTRSRVDAAAEWPVPTNAGPCTLRVYGQVRTTLKLVEEW